jgi:glycosyltransferase involved in cell wall biosynthesis
MRDSPEVTVVIPTRDRWRLLAAHALPSALSQEDVELEVIVVDDGSTDETPVALARQTDARLRVARHNEPRGVARARNAGIAVARGEWIAFLDDDDLWAPKKIRTQLDRAESADFVYARAVLVDEDKKVIGPDVFPEAETLAERLLEGNVVPGGCSNILVRTALVRQVGGFDEELSYSADWDLWIRLARAGRAVTCDEILAAHFEHRGNLLFRYCPDVLAEFEYVIAKHGESQASRLQRRRSLLAWLAHEYRRAGYSRKAARVYLQIALQERSPAYLGRAVVALSGKPGRGAARMVRRAFSAQLPDADPVSPSPQPAWLELYS